MAQLADATLMDIAAGRAAMEEARLAIGPTQALCDIIAALPMTDPKERFQFERWEEERDKVQKSKALQQARKALEGLHPLHFPVAYGALEAHPIHWDKNVLRWYGDLGFVEPPNAVMSYTRPYGPRWLVPGPEITRTENPARKSS